MYTFPSWETFLLFPDLDNYEYSYYKNSHIGVFVWAYVFTSISFQITGAVIARSHGKCMLTFIRNC